jgi:hypothetical protein
MSTLLCSYAFDGPVPLSDWEPPYGAGIYAICATRAVQTILGPNYKLVYIGQSGNMSERGFTSHHRRKDWVSEAGGEDKLLIATYLMPNSTEDERLTVEQELIKAYKPPCNK